MNRQAREFGKLVWYDYGDVSLITAAERHATRFADEFDGKRAVIEVRCEGNPSIPLQVFDVEVKTFATVINPRRTA